jgi:hypothetical protein
MKFSNVSIFTILTSSWSVSSSSWLRFRNRDRIHIFNGDYQPGVKASKYLRQIANVKDAIEDWVRTSIAQCEIILILINCLTLCSFLCATQADMFKEEHELSMSFHDLSMSIDAPSVEPSSGPTVLAYDAPSAEPSSGPSVLASAVPSVEPSSGPTVLASDAPSVEPSSGPTVLASDVPSVEPSFGPTVLASAVPSVEPSSGPTVLASAVPSVEPSSGPTVLASDAPSVEPSSGPTVLASAVPSVEPSSGPTVLASDAPSVEPSSGPTVLASAVPSVEPSSGPTVLASEEPTDFSQVPSAQPSASPSNLPSLSPINVPSSSTSGSPTAQSAAPSSLPTIFGGDDGTCGCGSPESRGVFKCGNIAYFCPGVTTICSSLAKNPNLRYHQLRNEFECWQFQQVDINEKCPDICDGTERTKDLSNFSCVKSDGRLNKLEDGDVCEVCENPVDIADQLEDTCGVSSIGFHEGSWFLEPPQN